MVNDGNITDIIFMMPYFPFKEYPANCVRIDSFYIASNTLYKRTKEIASHLEQNGFELVSRPLHLKKMAELGGLGKIVHNKLLANENYGTKTTLQGISVVGKYEYLADSNLNKICDNCHKCDLACPALALDKGVFCREKCIRHKQDFAGDYFEIVDGRVLGCEECQKICPYNSRVKSVDMPISVQKIFDYQNVFAMIEKGKKGLTPLAELIGSNMARPAYIFNLVVNSLLSAKNFEYTDTIKQFENHNSEQIRSKVKFYLQSLGKF